LAFFISGLQLKPYIEGVNRAAREEMPDLASAHNHIHASVIAPAHCRIRRSMSVTARLRTDAAVRRGDDARVDVVVRTRKSGISSLAARLTPSMYGLSCKPLMKKAK